MKTISNMRELAKDWFSVAVEAADPALALRAIMVARPFLCLDKGRYIVIAVGKAACTMMEAMLEHMPHGANVTALVVTNYENVRDVHGCEVLGAAHPVPDENGEGASRKVIELLSSATKNDLVIALVSGGASALLPAPIAGVSLEDKIDVSNNLLSNGFDIYQTNLVRQHLSRLKGGGFVDYAAPAPVSSFILSDVVGDNLSVIASGLTASKIAPRFEAYDLVKVSPFFDQLPETVRKVLVEPEQAFEMQQHFATNTLIGSNRQSLEAILQAIPENWNAEIVSSELQGDVAEVAERLCKIAQSMPSQGKKVLLFGGETTVTLRGKGLGGRNQELALRFARAAFNKGLEGDWVFLSGGTDGRDGPTDAAGGLVDSGTMDRLALSKLNLEHYLKNNNSYHALSASGDLLVTGATGTNVADIQIIMLDR